MSRATQPIARELAAAKQLGIVTGYADNTFKPAGVITRQEMMVLAARALKAAGISAEGSGSIASYTDAGQISAYAKDSVSALLKYGVVNGKNNKLAPGDTLFPCRSSGDSVPDLEAVKLLLILLIR
ncbi:S-layer homology domain-containing protein [Paenibacillus rhizoplanae]